VKTGLFVFLLNLKCKTNNMNKLFIFIFGLSVSFNTYAQTLDWAKQFQGPGFSKVRGLAIDSEQSLYSTGDYNLTVDFNPDPNASFNQTSISSSDIYVAKLDSSGAFVWAKSYGSQGSPMADGGQAICTDQNNDVLITGFFLGIVNFNVGGVGGVLNSFGDFDVFVLKLDKDGNFLWVKQFGGGSFDDVSAISTDQQGNVFVTGMFGDTADFDPGPGNYNMVSAGGFDAFLVKLDANGNFVWAKQWGGVGSEVGQAIKIDPLGNALVGMLFRLTTDLDPGVPVNNVTANGLDDIAICKLDPNGNLIWARAIGGTGADMIESLSLDVNQNIVFAGFFMGGVDFDPGPGLDSLHSGSIVDSYIASWDNLGNHQWVRHFDGSDSQKAGAVSTNLNNEIIVCGWTQGPTTFCQGTAFSQTLQPQGGADIYCAKLNQQGDLQWVYLAGGPSFDEPAALTNDAQANFYMGGNFRDTVDFDFGVGAYNLSTSVNLSTAYMVRYKGDLITSFEEELDKVNLKVFPNPAAHEFSVFATITSEILLYDYAGRLVRIFPVQIAPTTINTEGLSPGLYYLQERGKGKITGQRLMIR
jgi:hypothetical protein